ncbi:hypothetical protein [Pseudomonas sp. Hg5Tf]|uniref:DNA-binding protein n=1 Tax=Pseudomonas sp. Hg7Tf TaxID=3236988 RepID=A0AB39HW16_9PSED|nr:hypothetical protein [Pseudomonas sp. Hg5Tf]MDH2559037.1 hypothetical protein [Pseudomonas sp. Hg5Tf]
MTDNQILVGAQRQAELEAAKAAFFASGGQVIELVSFQYKPRPLRSEPERETTAAKKDRLQREKVGTDARQSEINRVRELARTMTYDQAATETGISKSTLFRMSREGGFLFRRSKRETMEIHTRELERMRERAERQEREAKLCERIVALRDIGLSRNEVARQVDLSYGGLILVIERNKIDFPVRIKRK